MVVSTLLWVFDRFSSVRTRVVYARVSAFEEAVRLHTY